MMSGNLRPTEPINTTSNTRMRQKDSRFNRWSSSARLNLHHPNKTRRVPLPTIERRKLRKLEKAKWVKIVQEEVGILVHLSEHPHLEMQETALIYRTSATPSTRLQALPRRLPELCWKPTRALWSLIMTKIRERIGNCWMHQPGEMILWLSLRKSLSICEERVEKRMLPHRIQREMTLRKKEAPA